MPAAATPLRKIRLARTLTQAQMAALLSVSQQTYSRWEQGLIRPDTARREHIAAILNVTARQLWPPRPVRTRAVSAAEAGV